MVHVLGSEPRQEDEAGYLLDADWIISFLNGRRDAFELIERLADEGLAMSVITYGEIYEGVLSTASPTHHLGRLDEFADRVDVILPDTGVARHYGIIRSDLRSRGQLIPDNDIWIAATALAHDLTVVSRDQHFMRIPGLNLYRHV